MSKAVSGMITMGLFRVVLSVFLGLVSENTVDCKKLRKKNTVTNHNTFHVFQIRPLESGHLKKWEYQNN